MKQRRTYWIIFLCLFVSACLPEEKVKIYPVTGTTNVPVNAIITVYIQASAGITKDDIKEKYFQMSTCAETNTKKPSPEEKQDKKEEDEKTVQAQTPVEFYHQVVEFEEEMAKEKDAKKAKEEKQENNQGVLVYLIPKAMDGSDTPLAPGTKYCVTTQPFKNKNKEIIQQAQTSFTTETVSGFHFDEQAPIEDISQRELSLSNDYLVLDFKDHAVNPTELLNHIVLCQEVEEEQDASGVCKGFGTQSEFELFMFENLVRDKDEKINTSKNNLFAIKPRETNPDASALRIVLDPSLGKSSNPDQDTLERTLDVVDKPQGIALFSAITEKVEGYFATFRIGAKSL
ncbi:MAG: hypothetical protein KDD46_02875 [Bdellovibrionales bacterium]|nr:hypothetical protein [Bdellovibrionales bacterium]